MLQIAVFEKDILRFLLKKCYVKTNLPSIKFEIVENYEDSHGLSKWVELHKSHALMLLILKELECYWQYLNAWKKLT